MTFACLDFETANYDNESICAAGLAVFVDGELTESLYWLIKPPKGHGWFREDFTQNCHGITRGDVQHSPEFPILAAELLPRLTAADFVVAHNAQFDLRKLRGTLCHFDIPCPEFRHLCTLQLARRVWPNLPHHDLGSLAVHIGHDFHHHHAQDDAEAAGRVLLAMMKHAGTSCPLELARAFGMAIPTCRSNADSPATGVSK